jgi:D-aminopeptidase
MSANKRLRDYGEQIGSFTPGPLNAITDVKGVKVGSYTAKKEILSKIGTKKLIRTGLTAVVPYPLHIERRLLVGHFFLRPSGDVTGYEVMDDFCYLKSPIILANHFISGRAYNATLTVGFEHNREIWPPIIISLDDSYLNDMDARIIGNEQVIEAVKNASEKVVEGSAGAGTGLVSYGYKAGIGSSSRKVSISGKDYILGALVAISNLNVPLGIREKESLSSISNHKPGTLAIILATDAPLIPRQLRELAQEAALSQTNFVSSQDGIVSLAFATANAIDNSEGDLDAEIDFDFRNLNNLTYDFQFIKEDYSNIFDAAREMMKEAVCNALLMAEPVKGRLGREAVPISFDMAKKLFL